LNVRARDHRGLDGDLQAEGDCRRTRLRAGAQRRMAAEDFLGLREEWAQPRGRKSNAAIASQAIEAFAVLWPDHAIKGRLARWPGSPEEVTWLTSHR